MITSARFAPESRDAGLAGVAVQEASGKISSIPAPLRWIEFRRMNGRERPASDDVISAV